LTPTNRPTNGWFDSKSELPGISSVDPTIELGVNMSFPSADYIQGVRALNFANSSAMGPAPNTGILVGNEPQERAESSKGENFLDTPNHTPFQSKSPSPIPFHRGWSMGRGRGVGREGGGKFCCEFFFTFFTLFHYIELTFLTT